ncbi:MAG: alcohol dehydrogenase catalytic domain-containing protein, partial [Acidimicrobiia bacterium]
MEGDPVKAIVVSELGGPEKLEYRDHPDPSPGEDELVVEIESAGVNFIDTYHRTGLYDVGLPFIPGLEGSGVVIEAGPAVTELAVGDRVAWVSG